MNEKRMDEVIAQFEKLSPDEFEAWVEEQDDAQEIASTFLNLLRSDSPDRKT